MPILTGYIAARPVWVELCPILDYDFPGWVFTPALDPGLRSSGPYSLVKTELQAGWSWGVAKQATYIHPSMQSGTVWELLTGPEDAELSPTRQVELLLAGKNSFLPATIIHTPAPVTSARALQLPGRGLRGCSLSLGGPRPNTRYTRPGRWCRSPKDASPDGRTVANPGRAAHRKLLSDGIP